MLRAGGRVAHLPYVAGRVDGSGIQKARKGREMSVKRIVSRIALYCLIVLGAVPSAFAGLQIELVYIESPRQPEAPVVIDGGHLREIMTVAAEAWERVFKHGTGNWKVTIEYGWGNIAPMFFAKAYSIMNVGTTLHTSDTSASCSMPAPHSTSPLRGSSPTQRRGTTPNTSNSRQTRSIRTTEGSTSEGLSASRPVKR